MTVADLKRDSLDPMGDSVVIIYGFKPPEYAVYGTETRVMVEFADDPKAASVQRKVMAPLNPIRGEINGLIDGWRSYNHLSNLKRKAMRYDRRVADALVIALEEDIDGAAALLKAIKQDIIDERTAWARFEYLASALFLSFIMIAVAVAAGLANNVTGDLWRAAATGAVGAFFSISLAIRGRTILTDLQRTSNIMDATLRIMIGIIAASVLMALVSSEAVKITLGDAKLGYPWDKPWLFVLIIGFIGGFSERLVPDLLAKAGALTQTPPTSPAPLPPRLNAIVAAGASQAQTAALTFVAEAPDPLLQEADVDNCLCEVHVSDAEATPDDQLPAAAGGVATAASTHGSAS